MKSRCRNAWLVAALAAVALHAFVAVWIEPAAPAPAPAPVGALNVRLLPPPLAAAPEAPPVQASDMAAPTWRATKPRRMLRAAAAPLQPPAGTGDLQPHAVEHGAMAPLTALPDRQPEPISEAQLPLYPTSLPPSFELHYVLRRGEAEGHAVLSWTRAIEPSYTMQLDARLGEDILFRQVSVGAIDSAGVAPVRFTDRRPRGSTRAVNFQRERGLVTFSGPTVQFGLQPGMQDRLSWLVQLSAVVDADAMRAAAGAETRLTVVGVRGEVDVWTFVSAGPERSADAGATLLLVREPQRPWDLRVEVWLAPARRHLPVRVRLGTWPAGTPLELLLVSPEPDR